MVEELFPSIQTTLVDSQVTTALASKTFLEKAFLLHELFSVEGWGDIAERKSRHLYDLSKMMDEDFALKAIGDDDLWESPSSRGIHKRQRHGLYSRCKKTNSTCSSLRDTGSMGTSLQEHVLVHDIWR